MKIVWSPIALARIDEIADFIALENINAARKWIFSVFKSVERLKRFPMSGRWVQEANRPDIREIVSGQFRVIYRLENDQIAVLTVRHSRQLLHQMDVSPSAES